MKVFVFTAAILATFLVFSILSSRVLAQTISNINASVKISICGNGIIEGGEDCEGNNLNDKGCSDIAGFSGGTLSCDISCAFNTSKCIKVTLTPTPTLNPPKNSDTKDASKNDKSEGDIIPTLTPTPTVVIISSKKNLPILVQLFGDQKSGTIEKVQLRTVLSDWVSAWKESIAPSAVGSTKKTAISTCDTDSDGSCDIKDFSVLLFYAR